MRGYRRRQPLSYLAGVAAAVVLVTQLGGNSLSPPRLAVPDFMVARFPC